MTPRRVTIVASELLGRAGTGGAGTADSLLAVALGRHGHPVRLLVASGRDIGELNPTWTRIYADAGVDVRVLEAAHRVRPTYLSPPLEVYHALRDDPPDVAIVNEWRGLGWAALRARQTGLALTETAFVVHCHSPGRVLTAFAQKVPDTLERFGEDIVERASVELADAVISPSAWLLDWMRTHAWPVPDDARVIQYVRQSAALGDAAVHAPPQRRIGRLAFFGQLREGKGIRIFLGALGRIEPALLDGVEVLFLGSDRPPWTSERIAAAVPAEHLSGVRVESRLGRDAALGELRTPGTLAVMPSLLDNSPNTVSECIEHGIPFVATDVGGIPELVATDDRARVLCGPTDEELAAALTRALGRADGFAPARAAREAGEAVSAWLDVVETVAPRPPRAAARPTAVAVVATTEESERHARRLARVTQSTEVNIVRASTRVEGVRRAGADWIVFLDDDEDPDDRMLDMLVAAQATSGADVVTAAVRRPGERGAVELFLGDARALGLVENRYGVIGLMRRTPQFADCVVDGVVDSNWPLLARLALEGAWIVSIPEPVSTHRGRLGSVADVPGDAVAVLEIFERHGGTTDAPQLAATLAAALRRGGAPHRDAAPKQPVLARALVVLRAEGPAALVDRVRARVRAGGANG
ncbi:MAG TPA: glycosyltransferase family 4 protein [Gaiellaceae bacterium]|nr:glycosyltransferase family 4 protein [Gaiellaceae bacterium]